MRGLVCLVPAVWVSTGLRGDPLAGLRHLQILGGISAAKQPLTDRRLLHCNHCDQDQQDPPPGE